MHKCKCNDFWHKIKINNVDPYNVFLAIATNIPVLLKTGFVIQGRILFSFITPLIETRCLFLCEVTV